MVRRIGAAWPADVPKMQQLAQATFGHSPKLVDLTMGELAYQAGMAKTAPPTQARLQLWMDGGDCLAWGWFFPPHGFEYAVHPSHHSLVPEVFDWLDGQASPEVEHRISTRDSDSETIQAIRARGFVDDPEHIWMRLNYRTLDDLEEPTLPAGFRLRTVSDYGGDLVARVDVHQRSWADLGTRVALDTYPAVMATAPYRSDLDFVLEAPNGTPAAFALGWYDEVNRVGEFEPVGTDPRFRGKGLGRVILLLGMQRFREAGATAIVVASRGDAGHPAPSKLYESVGFTQISRQCWFVHRPS